jgi:hypothetical protein
MTLVIVGDLGKIGPALAALPALQGVRIEGWPRPASPPAQPGERRHE